LPLDPPTDVVRRRVPRIRGDEDLRPRGWQRLAIRLYLATAACVALWTVVCVARGNTGYAAFLGGVLLVYCVAFAAGLHRVRPSGSGPQATLIQYQQAFGDGPTWPWTPRKAQPLHAGLIVPFVIHGAAGLVAGVELVSMALSENERLWSLPFGGVGLMAGFGGLLLGWMPAIALTLSAERAEGTLVAGALGPLLIFGPILFR